MPEFLKKFLTSLSAAEAEALWLYLDGCDVTDMIAAALASHPEIEERNQLAINEGLAAF